MTFRSLTFGLCLLLTACSSLLPSSGPAPTAFVLNPASEFDEAAQNSTVSLVIALPLASAGLDSERVLLIRGETTQDYFADARWADRLPLMLQSLLAESFENSGKLNSVAIDTAGINPDVTLMPEIRDFQVEYADANAKPVLEMKIVYKLIAMPDRRLLNSFTLSWRQEVGDNSLAAILENFNKGWKEMEQKAVEKTLAALVSYQPTNR